MPNREGGYGGYQKKTDQQRQIHAPGTGGVRRISPDTYEDLPNGRQPRTAHRPVSGAQRRRQPEPRQPQPRRAAYRPARPAAAEPDDGWIRPPQPTRRSQPRPQADPARDAMQGLCPPCPPGPPIAPPPDHCGGGGVHSAGLRRHHCHPAG